MERSRELTRFVYLTLLSTSDRSAIFVVDRIGSILNDACYLMLAQSNATLRCLGLCPRTQAGSTKFATLVYVAFARISPLGVREGLTR